MQNNQQFYSQSISDNLLQGKTEIQKEFINYQLEKEFQQSSYQKGTNEDEEQKKQQSNFQNEGKQNSQILNSNFGELEAFLNLLLINYKKELQTIEKNKRKAFDYDDVNLNQLRYEFFIKVKEQLSNHKACFPTIENKMKYLLIFFSNLEKIESGIKLKIKNYNVRMFSKEMDQKVIGELITKISNSLNLIIEHVEKLEIIYGISIKSLEKLNNFEKFFNEIGMSQEKCQELYETSKQISSNNSFLNFFQKFHYPTNANQIDSNEKCQRYFEQISATMNSMEKFFKLKIFEIMHQTKKIDNKFEIMRENILLVLNQFLQSLLEKSSVSISNQKIKQELWEQSGAAENILEEEIEDWIVFSKKLEEEIKKFD